MSKRIINDPSQHGWVEKDGEWAWKGSGSGGPIKLDDLEDVSAALPNRDDLIVWNGTQWLSQEHGLIETALTFQGGYDLMSTAPANPQDGDLYISNTDGAVDASWGPIGGTPVNTGNVVGYSESKGRWYLLGDLSSTAVTSISQGAGVSVDSSKPREPVVGVNFGTAAGQVAEGNHNHDSVYLKDAPKDGESYVRKDGGWEKSAGGGGGGGGTFSPRGSREEIDETKDTGSMAVGQRRQLKTINGPMAIEFMYGHVGTGNIFRGGHVIFVIDGMEYRKLSTGTPANFDQTSENEKSSVKVPMIYAGKLEIFVSTEDSGMPLNAGDTANYRIKYWPI